MSVKFDYPAAWRPSPGETLEGTVTEITEYDGGGFGGYPILTVGTEDGEKAVHAFHTVLRNELAKLDIQVGEKVAILYGGKQRSKDGSVEYEGYRVKAPDRKPRRFAWGDSDNGDETSGNDLVDDTPGDDGSDLPF